MPTASHNQGSVEVLENDRPAPARDANCFYEFFKIVSNQHNVGTFSSDIRPASHGYSDRCLA